MNGGGVTGGVSGGGVTGTPQQQLERRVTRLRKALALERADRTPVILQSNSFSAVHMGVSLARFCESVQASHRVMLDSIRRLDCDGFNTAFSEAPFFPMIIGSAIKLPGRELPPDQLWMIHETEAMTPADYDTIIAKGWNAFFPGFLKERLGFDLDDALRQLAYRDEAVRNFEEAGYVVYSKAVATSVNEYFGGGRSMAAFMRDLYRIPDKVQAAIDVALEESLPAFRAQIRQLRPIVCFVSPARGASEFFRPRLWERFVWRYVKAMADAVIEEGAVCNLHCDGNWERDLHYFRDFPKGGIVFESDGGTDIYKVKEVLGDRVCIKGDVPSQRLVLGNPDEIYAYCTKLIRDIGPGLILSTGCSIPPNAKVENIEAVIAAAKDN